MSDLVSLKKLIESQLKFNHVARISEEKLADAVAGGGNEIEYNRDIKSALQLLCIENDWVVRRDFDKGEFIFQKVNPST